MEAEVLPESTWSEHEIPVTGLTTSTLGACYPLVLASGTLCMVKQRQEGSLCRASSMLG